jgi:hypothetical protein
MNRGWSKVARGKHEMSDRTKFESIRVLNTALMERLGEVTGQLIRCQEELSALKSKYEGEIAVITDSPPVEEIVEAVADNDQKNVVD